MKYKFVFLLKTASFLVKKNVFSCVESLSRKFSNDTHRVAIKNNILRFFYSQEEFLPPLTLRFFFNKNKFVLRSMCTVTKVVQYGVLEFLKNTVIILR